MKKKKFITPKMRVIKLEAEELLAASTTPEDTQRGVRLKSGTIAGYDDDMFDNGNNSGNN